MDNVRTYVFGIASKELCPYRDGLVILGLCPWIGVHVIFRRARSPYSDAFGVAFMEQRLLFSSCATAIRQWAYACGIASME